MFEHHKRAVEKLVNLYKDDGAFLAMIVAGSVAKGWANPDSDLDYMLVVSEEEFEKRRTNYQLHVDPPGIIDYPGCYVDGKIISLQFLRDVADHGSEPARFAFYDASVAYSNIPQVEDVLKKIPVYPIHQQEEKMISFYTQVIVWQWYVGQSQKTNDLYLLTRSASQLALFGGRLILAHNKMLYPYHKWFTRQITNAPQKPDGFLTLLENLLKQPSVNNADLFANCVLNFRDWPKPKNGNDGVCAKFFEDSEWNWHKPTVPVEDR
jgi:hypothetical protein